jgi:isopentenyl-diphosphate delta-isomerase
VFVGEFNGPFVPDETEVENWRWAGLDELRRDMSERPEAYTYWLRVALATDGWRRVESSLSSGRPA